MKKPSDMKKIETNVEEVIKENSNKPHWSGTVQTIEDDKLVAVSLRMNHSLKKVLEEKAASNKKKREYPYSLTDFIVKAVNEYVENHQDYFNDK